MQRLLVVGAQEGGLGWHVANCGRASGYDVVTAGVSGEDIPLNITDHTEVLRLFWNQQFQHVVCTVGVNLPGSIENLNWHKNFQYQMGVNVNGPAILLRAWSEQLNQDPYTSGHFVVISSNSAHIARSQSAGYCASKAALSMMVRCVARELAGGPAVVYAYEPGWMDGTPMSEHVLEQLPEGVAPHRIPGGVGLDPVKFAVNIVNNIEMDNRLLNGCTLRVDGGEQ